MYLQKENSRPRTARRATPPLPQVWIGYLLGVVTIVAEIIAVELHPELAKGGFTIPPLYLFLSAFVGGVYWLGCAYQYHVVLAPVPGWNHPLLPPAARGLPFFPLHNLYCVFKWPQGIRR